MRLKDHKRLVIGAQKLIRKAAALDICDFTGSIYASNFTVTDPEVQRDTYNRYLKLLLQIGVLAEKAGNTDFVIEIGSFVTSIHKGGVKRL